MMFCSIYRLLISSALDGDKDLSSTLSRHIEKCPQCRAFRDSSVEIGSALSRNQPEKASTVTAEQISGIFQAAAESSPVIPMARSYSRYYAAAATILIVASVGFVMYRNNQTARRGDWAPVARAIDDVKNAGQTFAGPLVSDPLPAAIPFAMEKPLVTELDDLNSRTRSAVRFLIDCTPYRLPKASRSRVNN